jgi:hypothetical protein
VDQILHTDDTVLAKVGLNERVIGQRNALLVNLSVTALVDQLASGLEVRVSVGDPWLNDLEHLKGGLGQTNEDTIVDLEETEELQGLALLRVDLVDTLDTDDKDKLGFSRDVERAVRLRGASKADLFAFCVTVLLNVGFGTLEDDFTLLLVLLLDMLARGQQRRRVCGFGPNQTRKMASLTALTRGSSRTVVIIIIFYLPQPRKIRRDGGLLT